MNMQTCLQVRVKFIQEGTRDKKAYGDTKYLTHNWRANVYDQWVTEIIRRVGRNQISLYPIAALFHPERTKMNRIIVSNYFKEEITEYNAQIIKSSVDKQLVILSRTMRKTVLLTAFV